MITYVSLFLGAVSAILGALLTPKRKDADGTEHLNPWAAVFVILPLVAFGVAAWDNRNRDADHRREVANLDAQLEAETKLSGSLERQVELSNDVIKGLQTRVETSIKRVEVVEARITYTFTLKEARFSDKLPAMLQNLLLAETVGYDDPAGDLKMGVISKMFDFIPNVGNYTNVSNLISDGLANMSQIAAPRLLIAKNGAIKDGLQGAVQTAVQMPLPSIVVFDDNRVPDGVASYVMVNPRQLDAIPPLYIALAEESWFIPDQYSSNPVLELTWRFRFLNNQSVGLISTTDFQGADVEVYAPRPNPNYDRSPNLMAFGKPFGQLKEVEISAGGHDFKWQEGFPQKDQVTIRNRTTGGAFEMLGQLVHLEPQKDKESSH